MYMYILLSFQNYTTSKFPEKRELKRSARNFVERRRVLYKFFAESRMVLFATAVCTISTNLLDPLSCDYRSVWSDTGRTNFGPITKRRIHIETAGNDPIFKVIFCYFQSCAILQI